MEQNYQSLKGAVGATVCQNEAQLKLSMEIDHQNSSTDQAGKIRLAEIISLIFPACSVSEMWESMSI